CEVQKLYAVNPLSATAFIRSGRGIGDVPAGRLNISWMLFEMVSGGAAAAAASVPPRSAATGSAAPARSRSRRLIVVMRATITLFVSASNEEQGRSRRRP